MVTLGSGHHSCLGFKKRLLGREDPLEKDMETHSSVLAWRIPWTEEPSGLSPQGCKETDMTENNFSAHVALTWELFGARSLLQVCPRSWGFCFIFFLSCLSPFKGSEIPAGHRNSLPSSWLPFSASDRRFLLFFFFFFKLLNLKKFLNLEKCVS